MLACNNYGIPYINSTNATTCYEYEKVNKYFSFDTYQLVKVIIAWTLFVLSAAGNLLVMKSLQPRMNKSANNILMFHLAAADLIYALTVILIDVVWNMAMQWYGGDGICKFSQMLKQFGMYYSANMIVVIGFDRMLTIWRPIRESNYLLKRAKLLVCVAALLAAICSVPATIFFSVCKMPTCEGIVFTQCVDDVIISGKLLPSYRVFTMLMSFLLPLFLTILEYFLLACAILKMKEIAHEVQGPGDKTLQHAVKKTIHMAVAITLTSLVSWGPYYVVGILDWFYGNSSGAPAPIGDTVRMCLYLVLYLNSLFHPIVFGFYLKDVRENFVWCVTYPFKKTKRCPQRGKQTYIQKLAMTPICNNNNTASTNEQTKLMTVVHHL